MIDAFNINIVRQMGKNLEILSSEKIKPKDIGIKLNENGEIFCMDNKYKIKEITEEKSSKILKDMEQNYSLWKNYMSTSENSSSPQLSREGERLT